MYSGYKQRQWKPNKKPHPWVRFKLENGEGGIRSFRYRRCPQTIAPNHHLNNQLCLSVRAKVFHRALTSVEEQARRITQTQPDRTAQRISPS